MQELINKVLQWGLDKGITGPSGKATPWTQAEKMYEEATETLDAVAKYTDATHIGQEKKALRAMDEIKDGIGDTCVTLILLAERCGMTLEECLRAAYDVISRRTGRMVNGTFVKDKEGA